MIGTLSEVIRSPRAGRIGNIVLLLACLAAGVLASVGLGQSADFDLLNYHLYNPFGLVAARAKLDFFPALYQSYLNPLADLPYYLMAVVWFPGWPRLVAGFQGLPYGLAIFAAFRVNRAVFPERTLPAVAMAAIATLIGVTGAVTFSEIGTTFNDVQVSVLVLLGLLLPLPKGDGSERGLPAVVAGGIVLGIAAGLKLTAAMYGPAAVAALFVVTRPWSRSVALTAVFCGAWLIGFLLSCGWWGFILWQATGNPFFPFYNGIFHSDWIPAVNFRDGRFRIASPMQGILLPFLLSRGNSGIVGELYQRDARFAAVAVGWLVVLFLGFLRLVRGTAKTGRRLGAGGRGVVAFTLVAYFAWMAQFMILRYAVAVEVLTGTLIVLAIRAIVGSLLAEPIGSRLSAALALPVAAGLILWTIVPDWGRVPYGERVFSIGGPRLPEDSLVVIVGVPFAYLIPFVAGPTTRATSVVGWLSRPGGHIYETQKAMITGHTGPIFTIGGRIPRPVAGPLRHWLATLGLAWDDFNCAPIPSNIGKAWLCPAGKS